MTISKYLDEFRRNDEKRENLLNWDAGDLRRDEAASNSVVTTWQISFERIREERPSATDLLSLMSFFNPQGIPESILRNYSRSVAKPVCEDEVDGIFDEDFDILQAYSLISATAETDLCEMHALVQFCTRVWLSNSSDSERWNEKFLALMAREFPVVDFKNWAKFRQLLPHVESLYEMELSGDKSVKEWIQVLNSAARYIETAQGKYSDAERLNRRALEKGVKELGIQHPDTLTSVSYLASVLQCQGKYDEAERLSRRALEGYEKELGVQHPDTLTSVSYLVAVLQYQGKYDEAERLSRWALEGTEKELGVQHPDTLTSVSNLASVLQYQGKYDEAERLSRRALEGSEKELGVQHPDTLTSVSNLAAVLQYQGKYDEAERLSRWALEGREKELGVQHPNTLTSVYFLAFFLHKQKRYEEASGLYQRAYDGLKQRLGSNHPSTIACDNHYICMQQEAEQEQLGQSRILVGNR
jgi:tetratricopeptide (TPR) repeat protein